MPSSVAKDAGRAARQRADAARLRALMMPSVGGGESNPSSYEADYHAVQTAALRGVRRMLGALHLEWLRSGRAAPPTRAEEASEGGPGDGADAALVEALEDAQRHPPGFALEERASLVEGAGAGAFVAEDAAGGAGVPRGAVAALYPGLVYLRERQADGKWESSVVWSAGEGLGADRIGDYLVTRYDGTIVDGRIDASTLLEPGVPPGFVLEQGDERAALATRPNAFALGHMANHPPPGVVPNVAACPLDVPLGALPQQLVAYLPNKLWQPPGTFNKLYGQNDYLFLVRGVVLVALRDVAAGEELLVDYRFNPGRATPEWYTPCPEPG